MVDFKDVKSNTTRANHSPSVRHTIDSRVVVLSLFLLHCPGSISWRNVARNFPESLATDPTLQVFTKSRCFTRIRHYKNTKRKSRSIFTPVPRIASTLFPACYRERQRGRKFRRRERSQNFRKFSFSTFLFAVAFA